MVSTSSPARNWVDEKSTVIVFTVVVKGGKFWADPTNGSAPKSPPENVTPFAWYCSVIGVNGATALKSITVSDPVNALCGIETGTADRNLRLTPP